MSELHWYANQNPPPLDSLKTIETLEYLTACHNLFESGFLSHEKIESLNSDAVQNIDTGYQYFASWLSEILDKGNKNYYLFISVEHIIVYTLDN